MGSMNYLTTTRPNIAYSVSILSQFMAKPHHNHWKSIKRFLQYLKGTVNFGIKYTNDFSVELTGHSNWARTLDDKRSISRYVFSVGSGFVSWNSKKQSIFSLSSKKVDYKEL